MRCDFDIGDLVQIDMGYNAGIWLRPASDSNISPEGNHVQGVMLVVLEIDYVTFTRDRAIKVLSCCGKVGWTFESRLRKIT